MGAAAQEESQSSHADDGEMDVAAFMAVGHALLAEMNLALEDASRTIQRTQDLMQRGNDQHERGTAWFEHHSQLPVAVEVMLLCTRFTVCGFRLQLLLSTGIQRWSDVEPSSVIP